MKSIVTIDVMLNFVPYNNLVLGITTRPFLASLLIRCPSFDGSLAEVVHAWAEVSPSSNNKVQDCMIFILFFLFFK